jgi:ABC-type Fe3+ transport system permease subunit
MILTIIILLLAIPVGYLIAWLAKDELVVGKRWFRILIVVSILGIIGFWIYGFPTIAWTFGFLGVVSLVSFVKAK